MRLTVVAARTCEYGCRARRDQPPKEVIEGLERFRVVIRSQRQLFTAYPASEIIEESDAVDIWRSERDGTRIKVKIVSNAYAPEGGDTRRLWHGKCLSLALASLWELQCRFRREDSASKPKCGALIGPSCVHDERRADLIEHEVATLVGQRVFGIALGYEDLNTTNCATIR